MLSGCVEDPDMDTRLQKAKAPEVSETSMEGEAYASSITLKAAYAINDIDTAFSKTEGAYTTINGIGEVATLDVDSATVKATSTWVKGKVKNRGVGIEKLGFYYKKKKQTGDIEPSDQDSVIT